MQTSTIIVNGIEISYRDTGGNGPVVVCSSGISQSKEFWDPQLEALSPDYRVIAWDYPNHGESGLTHKTETAPTYATFLIAFLDALGIKTATLVGNSLGGAVSLQTYLKARERVNGLVLITPAFMGKEVFFPFRLMTLPVLGNVMTKPSDKAVEMQLGGVFHDKDKITDTIRSATKRNTYKHGGADAFLATMRATLGLRGVRPAVYETQNNISKSVTCPILFIHGRQDQILPVKHSQLATAANNIARIEVIENCGHAPQLEHPQQVNTLLKQFMVAT